MSDPAASGRNVGRGLPATRWLTRVSLWLRWFQRGHLHSYVLYILITVIITLVVARGELG